MKPHAFHPEAAEEYAEAARRYAAIRPELGGRFYDEIERLILEVRQHPDRFWQFEPPVRRHLSTLFPYAVLYLDQPDRVGIVAGMHCKRRPGCWAPTTGVRREIKPRKLASLHVSESVFHLLFPTADGRG